MSLDDILTKDEAVTLIASRLKKDGESIVKAKNRVSHLIADNANLGKLKRELNGKFVFRDLVRWAKKRYPGKFDDLHSIRSLEASFTISSGLEDLPDSIEACHIKLVEAYETIAALKPLAEKYSKNCKTNRKSAQIKRDNK